MAPMELKTKKDLASIVNVQLWVISRDIVDCAGKSMHLGSQKPRHGQGHGVVASMLKL